MASTLNFFPGHMAKAMRQMKQIKHEVDVVIEIRDARAPFATANHELHALFGPQKLLTVFNKVDLITHGDRARITRYFQLQGLREPIFLSALSKKRHHWTGFLTAVSDRCFGAPPAIASSTKMMHSSDVTDIASLSSSSSSSLPIAPITSQRIGKSRRFSTVDPTLMIAGFPNVGKSSIIANLRNLAPPSMRHLTTGGLAERRASPGTTRHLKSFRLVMPVSKGQGDRPSSIRVIDTPGVCMPGNQADDIGLKLALLGIISERIITHDEVAAFLYEQLRAKGLLQESDGGGKDDGRELPLDGRAWIKSVCEERGFRLPKAEGSWDLYRGAAWIVREYRRGRWGKFVLDSLE